MTLDHESPDRQLRAGLARLRRRWLAWTLARALRHWAVATLVAMAVAGAALALTRPAGTPLLAAVAGVGAWSLAALVVAGWPYRRRPSDLRVARYAEERVPALEQRLLSAAELAGRDPGTWTPIERLVASEGARAVAVLDPGDVVPTRALARAVATGALATAAVLVVLIGSAGLLDRAWQTARARWLPATLRLVVEPGDAETTEGGDVPLRVRIEGVDPEAWDAPVEIRSAASHLRNLAPLARDGDAWAASMPAGVSSFFYRVSSGRLVSPEFRVEVRRRPRVERIALHYEYPSFSGLAPRTEEDGGDVFAPAGTRVTVRVHTRDPIGSGTLAMAEGDPVPLSARDTRVLEGRFEVTREDAYRVALRDPHGLTANGDTEYFIRPMEDRPPEVRVIRPGGDARVTRLEEVVIEARADDDFGVARFELVYAPRGGSERVVRLGAGGTSVTGRHVVYLEDLDVRPGDFVTYYARARDIGRGKRPTETRSDIFFLEVRPFNEEFEAARTQAGNQGGGDGDFDDLARLQKDIIVATWRLDRRSGAGKSAQDIGTVARSQAEVRTRAEQMARQLAPRAAPGPRIQLPPLPGPQPQPPQPPQPAPRAPEPPQENPMRRAVEAMGRAQQALEALDTRAALPHEHEALNEILRAQAEVQRRQVSRQQQARGGRGRQSGNQDLSALFDRELQRQQETNYEQRNTTSERQTSETRREDEQLRRLRELAARQDELGRQQQELARRRAQMAPEEVKRRLERLSREQEQLRQQAEQLARQMQERGAAQPQAARADGEAQGEGQGEPSNGSSGGQQASGEPSSGAGQAGAQADARNLRDAAREMAGASGDLRREAPEQASARAARALERLRAAERGLAGAAPDERRRRAGELQSEARQLAEAERRIAEEAASAGDAESLRRLGAQQSRLAERAEALERAARDAAAREPGGTAGDAVRRAVRDLSAGRVGERLREGATGALEASEGRRDAQQAARELAAGARAATQPLDRLADRLGEASGQDAESRRLSDSLARTRELRERLGELQRQAAAQGQAQGQDQGQVQGQGNQNGRAQQGRQRGDAERDGQDTQRRQATRSQGQGGGGPGGEGGRGGGEGRGGLEEMRQQMLRELRQAGARDDRELASAMSSLEGWSPSSSAPGTEAWKQDFARWDVLKRQIDLAIERQETTLAARLAEREARHRLEAGGDDRPSETWQPGVAEYFRSLARTPRR